MDTIENKNTQESAPGYRIVQYEAVPGTKVGPQAMEYTEPGHVIDWNNKWTHGDDREIIVTTASGNEYFVKGKTVINVGQSIKFGREVSRSLWGDGAEFPEITIGEPWSLREFYITSPVEKVLISHGLGRASRDPDKQAPLDPFREVKQQIKAAEKRGLSQRAKRALGHLARAKS